MSFSFATFAQNRLLTKEEMYEDFDSIRAWIYQYNPYLETKMQLFNYSIMDTIDSFREEVELCSDYRDFYLLTTKVMNSCLDGHCAIRTRIEWPTVELYIPLMYRKGTYQVSRDFTYEGKSFAAGSVLTAINGNKEIHEEVTRQIPFRYLMRWDNVNKVFYSELFFWSNKYIETGEVTLDFAFENDTISTTFKMDGLVQVSEYPNRLLISDRESVQYFEDEQILYVRVPDMNWKLRKFYKREIPRVARGKVIDKVVVDVRNNAGGSSMVGRTIFQSIIAEPIRSRFRVVGNDPKHFSWNYRRLHRISKESDLEVIEELGNTKKYVLADRMEEIKPLKSSIRHKGQIYIIGNEHVFSAGAAIFSFADYSKTDSIYSIGTPTGWFLGEFFDPITFKLPNSKIEGIISSSMAMTNVNGISEVMLDAYDFEIYPTLSDYNLRYNYGGSIYRRPFLLNFDPYFKPILNSK